MVPVLGGTATHILVTLKTQEVSEQDSSAAQEPALLCFVRLKTKKKRRKKGVLLSDRPTLYNKQKPQKCKNTSRRSSIRSGESCKINIGARQPFAAQH